MLYAGGCRKKVGSPGTLSAVDCVEDLANFINLILGECLPNSNKPKRVLCQSAINYNLFPHPSFFFFFFLQLLLLCISVAIDIFVYSN